MIRLQSFLPDAVAAIVRKAPLTPEKVAFAWRTAVGPSVDRTTTVALEGSVLKVRAQNAAWRREIERSAALIRKRMDDLLGSGIVRSLDVTIE